MRVSRRGRLSKQKQNHSVARASFEALEDRRLLSAAIWTGAAGDGLFTDANNWQGNVAPTAGQDITFPAGATSTNVIINSNVTVGITEIDASYNISASNGGSMTLNNSLTATVGDVTISAPLVLSATQVIQANDLALINITGGISDASGSIGGIIKQGNGVVELTGTAETYTGETTGGGGTLVDTATLAGPVGIHTTTNFYGSSTFTDIAGYDGEITPATFNTSTNTPSPATMTATQGIAYSDASPDGTLNFLIGGPSDSSKIDATGGTINLNSVTFSGTIVNGYVPSTGDVITLIQNNTGQPITNTFNNLPQGSTVTLAGHSYTLSYTGGSSGHDVTLTAAGTAAGITINSVTNNISTHGHTAAASVSATDSNSSENSTLTYTWSTTHVPPGGKQPKFSASGTHAAGATTVTFYKDGTYVLQCLVKDSSGNTQTVGILAVVGQKATSIKLEPHGVKLAPHKTQQFTASLLDQFGHPMRVLPTYVYKLSASDGTISSTGLFTAGTKKESLDIDVTGDNLSAFVGVVVT
jgi:hypothetical protein